MVLIYFTAFLLCFSLHPAAYSQISPSAAPSSPSPGTNPLLVGHGIPLFALIEPHHIEPGVQKLIKALHQDLTHLENTATPTWEGLITPFESLYERYRWIANVLEFFTCYKNTEDFLAAYFTAHGEALAFFIRLYQSPILFGHLIELAGKPLTPMQKRAIHRMILTFRENGADLSSEKKAKLLDIKKELYKLENTFESNLKNSLLNEAMLVHNISDLEGIDGSYFLIWSRKAKQLGFTESSFSKGPWALPLDCSTFQMVMRDATHSSFRKQMYEAYSARATTPPYDNRPIVQKIFQLRHSLAQLLNAPSFAHLQQKHSMIGNVEKVEQFLKGLVAASLPKAWEEVNQLKAFAASKNAPEANDFQSWDFRHWVYQYRREVQGYSINELAPYLTLPVVLQGLFELAHTLFGIAISEATPPAGTLWHPSVTYYEVYDSGSGHHLGSFYLDPFQDLSRKTQGAWSMVHLRRSLDPHSGHVQKPVVSLGINVSCEPHATPFLSLNDVSNLFHEFGHALQTILNSVDESWATGMKSIEKDGVEIPSKLMELWVNDEKTFAAFTRHYVTGEPVPTGLFEKMRDNQNFLNGINTHFGLFQALVDLGVHAYYSPESDLSPQEWSNQYAHSLGAIYPNETLYQFTTFSHIMSGRYAATFYGYAWSETLAADLFSAFQEAGLHKSTAVSAVGRRLRETLFSPGGSVPFIKSFVEFRGRQPNWETYLEMSGFKKMEK